MAEIHKLSDFDPNVLFERFVRLGKLWATLDGDARHLEECKSSVESTIFLAVEGKSIEERKARARSHMDYIKHIDRMCDARTKANLAKIELEGARAWLDVARTLEASRRAEMSMR